MLYKQAFMHNSISKNVTGLKAKNNNERLEYLGDAVWDLVIAELLFKKYPFQGEGFLTEMRSKSVSRKKLSEIAFDMGLEEHLKFDKSIRRNHAAVRGIAGNALEALIGAIYLDKGYKFTKRFIRKKIVGIHLDFDELKNKIENFKSLLNQYAQKEKKELEFKVLNNAEDKNIKTYIIGVFIDGEEVAKGRGKSKKVAEQLASEKTCEILKLV
jgi:ribonuclease-3